MIPNSFNKIYLYLIIKEPQVALLSVQVAQQSVSKS